MQFSSIVAYFLSISLYILLSYNFLKTILCCFQKELLTDNRHIRKLQQYVLIVLFICMIVYHIKIETTELSILPWIWGFLAGHLFCSLKKRWINELLGLGILLAITIVLFFKQTEMLQLFTENNSTEITTITHVVYMSFGILLGKFLWQQECKV